MLSNKTKLQHAAEIRANEMEAREKFTLQASLTDAMPLEHFGWLHAFPRHQTKAMLTVFVERRADAQAVFEKFDRLPLVVDRRGGSSVRVIPARYLGDMSDEAAEKITEIAPFVRELEIGKNRTSDVIRFYADLELARPVFIEGAQFRTVVMSVKIEVQQPEEKSVAVQDRIRWNNFSETDTETQMWFTTHQVTEPKDVFGDARMEEAKNVFV